MNTSTTAYACSCHSSQLPSCFRRNHQCVLQSFLAAWAPWHNRASTSPTSCFHYVWLHGKELLIITIWLQVSRLNLRCARAAAPPKKGRRFEKSKREPLKLGRKVPSVPWNFRSGVKNDQILRTFVLNVQLRISGKCRCFWRRGNTFIFTLLLRHSHGVTHPRNGSDSVIICPTATRHLSRL